MDSRRTEVASPRVPVDAVVISQVRLLRDCLAELLAGDPEIRVHEGCATLAHAKATVTTLRPGMVLLDGAFPDGPAVASQLHAFLPAAKIVAIAVPETEESVLRWAEAGVAGYVPDTAPLSELSALLRQISWGEQYCSSRVAGALLRRVGDAPRSRRHDLAPPTSLTGRERDIFRLVGAGLTNKEIARRLNIGLGTTKTHVHNILGKLRLSNRSQIAAQMNRVDESALNRTLFNASAPIYTPVYIQSISSD